MQEFQILALYRHRVWLTAHIVAATFTLSLGPLQFANRLRARRPVLHRRIGYIYLAAVLVAGIAGLRLSPDTAVFLAEGFSEDARADVIYGLHPADWGIVPHRTYIPSQFTPVIGSFFVLGLTWLITTGIAFRHALRRDFARHRAWMVRSYSLSFAAVTLRLVPALMLYLLREPVLTANLALSSWVLNLVVAEWIIRRSHRKPVALAAHA